LTISGGGRHRVCVIDDAVAPLMQADGSFPLLIAVAASPDDRVRLAELVDGIAPLLLVSGLDELRRLITPAAQRRTDSTEPAIGHRSGSGDVQAADRGPASRNRPGAGHGSSAGRFARQSDMLAIDRERSVARWRNREVALTRLELDLLTCLNSDPLRTWSFADLHQAVWHSAADGNGDVQSLVKRLRHKLGELGTSVTVDAVRGTGFRLSDHQHPAIRH
jgi:DNA-binding response OmpR family regulator